MSELTQTKLEVPVDLVEEFGKRIRYRARSYAESTASEAKNWAKWADEGRADKNIREDADRHLDLTVATFALADQVPDSPDGQVTFEGSAWVLSDVADSVLLGLIDKARKVAFTAPANYEEVVALAERIAAWSRVCEEVDATYRRLDTESREAVA